MTFNFVHLNRLLTIRSKADDTITIETSQDEYSVDIDYFKDSGDVVVYYKNVAADDPPGNVLLPAGEIITITLPTRRSTFRLAYKCYSIQ